MKRLLLLAISLVLLAGCGTAVALETETIPAETTAAETTTQAPPVMPEAKPFTKDDITAIESKFKTLGDYVEAMPAAWYRVDHWDAYGCEIIIQFFDHEPNEDSDEYLEIRLHDEDLCGIMGDEVYSPTQEVPEILLDAEKTEIRSIDFAKAGDTIIPPRGIEIGGPAQKIFDSYPDTRTGDGDVLYDITAIYPEAKVEWGVWDGEGVPTLTYIGGGITQDGVCFVYTDQPWDWDERESDYTWMNMYNPRWSLSYTVENDVVTGIEYMLTYHPG